MADSTRSHTVSELSHEDMVIECLTAIVGELRILNTSLAKVMPLINTPAAKWALSRKMNRT